MRTRFSNWLLSGWAVLVFWGCASNRDESTLEIFAASSLKNVFLQFEKELESVHNFDVVFNFSGSQELRAQVEWGARPDIVALADAAMMSDLEQRGHVKGSLVFTRNMPVFVFSKSARRIRGLDELDKVERFVIGAPDVPIGRYAVEVFRHLREQFGDNYASTLESRIVSQELSAKQVLFKVQLGEADAGVAYKSDALASGLPFVEIPDEWNIVAKYAMAQGAGSRAHLAVTAWFEFAMSKRGQSILSAAGFVEPGS